MASIREAAQQVLNIARDGIGWIVFWKEGRGWDSDDVYVDYDESGTVAYDKDGIKIVLKDTYEEEYLGQCIAVYVSNQSDKNISVAGAETVSVNGKEVTPFFGSDVMKGKHDITYISFDEAENISKIENFEGSFCIYDHDTGDVLVEKTEPVSVAYE